MILVTVGTQLPFDRLIRIMDDIAPNISQPIVAQTAEGGYRPSHFEWRSLIDPVEFEAMFIGASLIVAHAGVGSVLMAMKHQKPIIVFPRQASLGEHRNDHQLATVAALEHRQGIYVAYTPETLTNLIGQDLVPPPPSISNPQRRALVQRLAVTIEQQARRTGTRSWFRRRIPR